MLFNSVVFLFGFPPDHLHWCSGLCAATRTRYVWLAVTGYVFYGYWNPWFTLLMLFSTLVSYFAGLGILRWSDARRRQLCLIIPVTTDLALLAFFKYANFGLDTARGDDASAGARHHVAAPEHHSPDRHLVLHLSHDQLHRRQLPRRHQADAQLLRVRRVRLALFAAHRGPDRAVPPDRGRISRSLGETIAHAGWGEASRSSSSGSSKK